MGAVKTFTAEQTLWSAGRERALVDSAQATTHLHQAQLLEAQYQIALRIVDAWQGVVQGTGRMREIGLTQQKLDEFQAFMQRRVAVGVSPKIEIELIATRVAQTRVDLQQSRAALMTARAKLEGLLGQKYSIGQLVGPLPLQEQVRLAKAMVAMDHAERLPYAVAIHPSVRKARYQALAAQFDLAAQQASQWPQVYARYQKTINEAISSNTDGLYVGLKYQPGAGFSSLAQARSALARAEGYMQSIDVAQHDLQDAVQADIQDFAAAQGRAEALQQAVAATELLQESYERQFVVGRRNWQDVMNAVRESNDVRLSLVDARSSILGASYRLRIRMGELPWQKQSAQDMAQ